jgi:hypothetical protein
MSERSGGIRHERALRFAGRDPGRSVRMGAAAQVNMATGTWPMSKVVWAMALGTGLMLVARTAAAHEVGLSRGVYAVRGAEVMAEVTFARGELRALVPGIDADGDRALSDAELAAGTAALQAAVIDGVTVRGDGQACPGTVTRARLTEEDGAVVAATYVCPAAPQAMTLKMPMLAGLASGHRHLGLVGRGGAGDAELTDVVLHARSPEATVTLGAVGEAPESSGYSVGEYFKLGVEHILIGTDHLVFLLGLVLIGGRLRSLIAVITAFTLGHSVSLAMATLQVWSPGGAIVEPAIALSIAYVGVENFFAKDAAGRWKITLPFGFIHGFGFAGVLADLGLPADAVVPALLLFNIGVEAGQLMVLAVILPLLLWLGRQAWFERVRGVWWISGAIVAAGLYWFVERVFLGE